MELLTLLPLTQCGARQEIIEYMLQTLRLHGDKNLEVIAITFASLVVRNDDRTIEWLRRRLEMMEDLFEDNPLFEGIKERIFNQGEQRGAVDSVRETTIALVDQRFPTLHELAQQQTVLIEDPHTLQTLIIHLALASTLDEARHTLLSWQD